AGVGASVRCQSRFVRAECAVDANRTATALRLLQPLRASFEGARARRFGPVFRQRAVRRPRCAPTTTLPLTSMPDVPRRRLAVLLFGSGCCALMYQVAWLRLLSLVFGASTAASAAVLAIFMGGLGLGGLVLGRRADTTANPLRLYARLELGVALAAALSPLLIAFVRAAYIGIGGVTTLGPIVGTALRLGLSALVLGVPTVLM